MSTFHSPLVTPVWGNNKSHELPYANSIIISSSFYCACQPRDPVCITGEAPRRYVLITKGLRAVKVKDSVRVVLKDSQILHSLTATLPTLGLMSKLGH